MNKNFNYMSSIYDVINDTTFDDNYDGVEYLDDPDEICYDDELSWGDDIIFLDEPEEELPIMDLGDGFIPLYQGETYQEEVVVIDEYYQLDEYEQDLVMYDPQPAIQMEEEVQVIVNNEPSELDKILGMGEDNISIIKFPDDMKVENDIETRETDDEDDKISKTIAKEYLENQSTKSALEILSEDLEDPTDDTSWVDNPDLFGNDVSVILAENPNEEIEEEFVEGSFSDWIKMNDVYQVN